MGRDERQAKEQKLMVLDSIRGHDSTVAHSFNHTDGVCPKCSCPDQAMAFCMPGSDLPRLRGCELSGEHLHRVCSRCRYPWIERCLDQAMLAEAQGDVPAESQLAAALALIVERSGGLTLDMGLVASYRGRVIHFERDGERGTITVTVSDRIPQSGAPRHPDPDDLSPAGGGGQG